jgi:hypothetical protein
VAAQQVHFDASTEGWREEPAAQSLDMVQQHRCCCLLLLAGCMHHDLPAEILPVAAVAVIAASLPGGCIQQVPLATT